MERRPASILCISLFTALAAVFAFVNCTRKSTDPSPAERGKYLAMAGGCGDCHSPKNFTAAGPVPDTRRLLSGYPSGAKLP